MSALTAEKISVRLGDHTVIHDTSLIIRSGELIGLVGPNGSGKTTLMRALANLVPCTKGRVLLDGTPIETLSRRIIAQHLGYLTQNPTAYWPLNVNRLVALGRLPLQGPWRYLTADDRHAIDTAMKKTGVAHLSGRPISSLSGGERIRVMLARVLAGDPQIVLADEPIAALDPYYQLQVMEFLSNFVSGVHSAIVILHDLTLATRFCHRLVLLSEGSVYADGPPKDVLSPATLKNVYKVQAKIGESSEPFVLPWTRVTTDGSRKIIS